MYHMRISDNMDSTNIVVEFNNYKTVNGNAVFCNGRNTLEGLTEGFSTKEDVNEFTIKNECIKIDGFKQYEIQNIKSEALIESLNIFSNEVVVKEEPFDDGSDEDQINYNMEIKQEVIEAKEEEITEVQFKEVIEDLSDALGKVSKKDVKPCTKFITKDHIKQEEEESDQKYLCSYKDISIKYLTVNLKRFKCFMCEHCPAFYKKKRDLLHHIHIEHRFLFQNPVELTKSLYYCGICGKKLTYKRWHAHITMKHSKEQWNCTVCNKVFKHKIYLQKHQMYVHKYTRPAWRFWKVNIRSPNDKVTCPLCSKEFNNKQSLHTHTKNCHSEKTYTCKICKSTLKCKSYLYGHMRRVHYDDGKVHSCDLCQKQFKSPRYLKIHIKNFHKYTETFV